jgi:hypothetical protein
MNLESPEEVTCVRDAFNSDNRKFQKIHLQNEFDQAMDGQITSSGLELHQTGSTASASGPGVRMGRNGYRTISGCRTSLAAHLSSNAASGRTTPVVWTDPKCKIMRVLFKTATFAKYNYLSFRLAYSIFCIFDSK